LITKSTLFINNGICCTYAALYKTAAHNVLSEFTVDRPIYVLAIRQKSFKCSTLSIRIRQTNLQLHTIRLAKKHKIQHSTVDSSLCF